MMNIITSIERLNKVITMKVKMDSLIITEYCSSDKRKIRFIKEISQDPLVNNYVSDIIYEKLEASEGDEKVSIGHSYIIEDKRKLVGFVTLNFLDKNGNLDLHYGVHPEYRRQGYGSKILLEIKEYVFKELANVNKIRLFIKKVNKGSTKCAINAGYKISDEVIPMISTETVSVYVKERQSKN